MRPSAIPVGVIDGADVGTDAEEEVVQSESSQSIAWYHLLWCTPYRVPPCALTTFQPLSTMRVTIHMRLVLCGASGLLEGSVVDMEMEMAPEETRRKSYYRSSNYQGQGIWLSTVVLESV